MRSQRFVISIVGTKKTAHQDGPGSTIVVLDGLEVVAVFNSGGHATRP
jgi:hypothetical protein